MRSHRVWLIVFLTLLFLGGAKFINEHSDCRPAAQRRRERETVEIKELRRRLGAAVSNVEAQKLPKSVA